MARAAVNVGYHHLLRCNSTAVRSLWCALLAVLACIHRPLLETVFAFVHHSLLYSAFVCLPTYVPITRFFALCCACTWSRLSLTYLAASVLFFFFLRCCLPMLIGCFISTCPCDKCISFTQIAYFVRIGADLLVSDISLLPDQGPCEPSESGDYLRLVRCLHWCHLDGSRGRLGTPVCA